MISTIVVNTFVPLLFGCVILFTDHSCELLAHLVYVCFFIALIYMHFHAMWKRAHASIEPLQIVLFCYYFIVSYCWPPFGCWYENERYACDFSECVCIYRKQYCKRKQKEMCGFQNVEDEKKSNKQHPMHTMPRPSESKTIDHTHCTQHTHRHIHTKSVPFHLWEHRNFQRILLTTLHSAWFGFLIYNGVWSRLIKRNSRYRHPIDGVFFFCSAHFYFNVSIHLTFVCLFVSSNGPMIYV